MQKVTLMFLPLNWNAGSVSVVTVFRTQETATFPLTWGKVISLPFTFFSFFPPALYLLTAAQSDPNTQYQEKLQSLGPWDFIPSGLTAVMGGTPQSFQGIDPFSATAKQACRSMPRRPLLSHPWKPFQPIFEDTTRTPLPIPTLRPWIAQKQRSLKKMIQKLMIETVTQRCLGMGLPGWFLILTHSQRL